ncbi:hypothetical protein OUZ56_024299 [Daphnia magna]|uniref:Uncharacterized protein n=1 Tax=Daphnia magna TaxID=35525 RepID=A0ABR0B0L1_9CRUS|nr:hypothetical protein OUZ56_024299 [Daphnia magna]
MAAVNTTCSQPTTTISHAFHSTVNVGCVPVRGDCSPQTTNNSLLFTALFTTVQQSSQTAPFFFTHYTDTNFNGKNVFNYLQLTNREQPATHYLLNRTVGYWLRSLLQLPSNHQLMFLAAPLTAFKHHSDASFFGTATNFNDGMLAAFHFAAHKQPPPHVCWLRSFCSPPKQQPTHYIQPALFLHPPDSHQFQRSIDCVPFCSPKATTNSLFLIAPLSMVQHPLQTGVFRIHLTATNCNDRDNPNKPPVPCFLQLCCLRFTILHRLPSFCTHETTTNFQGYVGCVPFCSHQTTNNSSFSTAPFTALQLPLDSLQ